MKRAKRKKMVQERERERERGRETDRAEMDAARKCRASRRATQMKDRARATPGLSVVSSRPPPLSVVG